MNAKLTYRPPVGSMAHGVIENEAGTIIASVLDTDETGRKLAAALELLEALANILKSMPDLGEFENTEGESMLPLVIEARAAIAKATGKEQA